MTLSSWAMHAGVRPLTWLPVQNIGTDDLEVAPRYGHALAPLSHNSALLVGGTRVLSVCSESVCVVCACVRV